MKYDVSLPSSQYYKLVEQTRQALNNSTKLTGEEKASVMTVGYGHVGDGNLHLNIALKGYDDHSLFDRVNEAVDQFIMDFTKQQKGSVSAEHGVGLQKASHLGYSKSPEMIKTMKQIKSLLDPNGILNPYKLLP